MKMKLLTAIMSLAIVVTMTACGGDEDGGTSSNAPAGARPKDDNSTTSTEEPDSKKENSSILEGEQGEDVSFSDEKKLEILSFINGQIDPLFKTNISDEEIESKSDQVWLDAEIKFNITENDIINIMMDTDLAKKYYNGISEKTEITEYDAHLNHDGESSLIAVNEDILKRYINALVNENQGTISELKETFQVSSVPIGTKVNIIEKNLTTAHVKILDGIFAGNEVWILIESLQEK